MIKVGIIGADQPVAGELIRILIRHPEVDIVSLYAPSLAGRRIEACHHGFIGENIVNFSDKIDPSRLDVLFLASSSSLTESVVGNLNEWPQLKIIDVSPERWNEMEAYGMEYGLSEINRKPLVRGARMASVPSSVASLALIALYPLASNLLLSSDITIDASIPLHTNQFDVSHTAHEIATMLTRIQNSFNSLVSINLSEAQSLRAMKIRITFPCNLSIAEIDRIYDNVYDDHNFTFTHLSDPGAEEVEGTQRCVISFKKSDTNTLVIDVIGDAVLRGGAGDAVHVMNLLFALDEKVGLQLKPSSFAPTVPSSDNQSSWFA